MLGDKLRMDYINSLPQPFIARFYGGDEWPIHDIEVQTGLLRIDYQPIVSEVEMLRWLDANPFQSAIAILNPPRNDVTYGRDPYDA